MDIENVGKQYIYSIRARPLNPLQDWKPTAFFQAETGPILSLASVRIGYWQIRLTVVIHSPFPGSWDFFFRTTFSWYKLE